MILDLVLVALATWYLSYAITATHGPFRLFETLRKSIPHGGLLECPICLAPYVALILLLVPMGVVVQALALAGAAMLMHGLAGWRFG